MEREKNGISYNKHGKKGKYLGRDISKSGKTSIQFFYWEYDQRIICYHYGETFERNGNNDRENFELIWDNDPKHTSYLTKEFYKNIVNE